MPSSENTSAAKYTVAANNMIPFPIPDFTIKKGEKLLTLWFDTDTSSWTNILYPCVAQEDYPGTDSDSIVLRVVFDEDPKVYMVNV